MATWPHWNNLSWNKLTPTYTYVAPSYNSTRWKQFVIDDPVTEERTPDWYSKVWEAYQSIMPDFPGQMWMSSDHIPDDQIQAYLDAFILTSLKEKPMTNKKYVTDNAFHARGISELNQAMDQARCSSSAQPKTWFYEDDLVKALKLKPVVEHNLVKKGWRILWKMKGCAAREGVVVGYHGMNKECVEWVFLDSGVITHNTPCKYLTTQDGVMVTGFEGN